MGTGMKLMAQNCWIRFYFVYVMACAKFILDVQAQVRRQYAFCVAPFVKILALAALAASASLWCGGEAFAADLKLSCDASDKARLEFYTDADWEMNGESTGGAWKEPWVAIDTNNYYWPDTPADRWRVDMTGGNWLTPGSLDDASVKYPTEKPYQFRRKIYLDSRVNPATVKIAPGSQYLADNHVQAVGVSQDASAGAQYALMVSGSGSEFREYKNLAAKTMEGNWQAGTRNYLVMQVYNTEKKHARTKKGANENPMGFWVHVILEASCTPPAEKELLSCDLGDTAELEFKTDAGWEVYGASTGGAWQPAFVALDTTERAASAYNPTVADGDWITPGSRTGTVPTTQAYHFRRKVVLDPRIDLATVQLDRAGTKYAVDDYLNSVMVTQDRVGIPDTPGRALVGRRNIQLYDVLEAGIDRTAGNWAAGDNYLVWKASNVQDFHDLSNGGQPLSLLANVKITATCKALSAPIITTPSEGAQVGSPQLSVAGTATPGTSVQIFVDGQATGSQVATSSAGSFSTTITLSEGAHQLTARASSIRGESAMSAPVNVTYSAAVPTVAFITPPANSTLTADTAVVEASASDASGITKLELYAGDQLLATCTTASCSATWQLEGVADGNYTLRAVATNTSGRTAEATRTVTVQKAGNVPPQPLALYEVQDFAITPAMSFGDVPIKITGQLVSTAGREPAASAALLLLLRTHGVDRRINLRSDANGRFDYSFVPQSTDAGTYEVRITHSDDAVNASRPADGSFTINRLSVDMSRYRFDATRGQTSTATVRVTASAGTGATGVHWKALPADQPSGSLPPGITLETGEAIDIAAGTTAPINIRLAGSDSAGATGTIILKLFANESGSTPRAELRLDYQLHEAQPRLVPDPTSLQLGVQQGATASAQVTITNKGFKPAHGVRAALQARPGHALPSWVKLISSPDIGALDVGASTVIQINASPDAEVPDGYHYAQLVVSADNDAGGSVPITIAVAREGQGNARFQFVDIYTGTTDGQGSTIEGLAGARITLQHETLSSDIRSATSNAQGIAEFEGLPPGNWRWRASAPGHIDASGRITINATATTSERVFLDYQLVTVEFSVTETTIQDVYDIVLEATYQTHVPAPVVVLEPTSINLPAMQQGEEITGELRLTNYGLVRADHLQFALPGTDENFKYEFFAELPEQLPAKSSVSIPYRITSLKPLAKGLQINLQADNKLKQIGADQQSGTQVVSAIRRFLGQGDTSVVSADTPEDTAKSAAKAASCTSYHTQACASYDYECASGDVRGGSTCASIGRITGAGCAGTGAGAIGGYGGSCNTPACGNGGGWGGGGWGGGAASIGLVPACMPSCPDCSAGTGNP